ncbi:hypothetical protein ACFL6P_09840 [Candidatus Latescibacterota bacterium]
MNKNFPIYVVLTLTFLSLTALSCAQAPENTVVAIKGDQFYINGELSYNGRYWNGNKVEGLLFNSRMVQGIFDDLNAETRDEFKYPDTGIWDPVRNTREFVEAMTDWRDHGLMAFTLNLQGGSPVGYGNHGWINSTFDSDGNLRPEYMARLELILDKADELGMAVILGYFYFGQDQVLEDEAAVLNAVDTITNWILEKGYRNILVEINNECNIRYDHEILQPDRVHELIERVQNMSGHTLPVSTSYGGGHIPHPNVVKSADFLLIHGNGVDDPARIKEMVRQTKEVEGYVAKPIVFNEDDHFDFDADSNNLRSAVESYASWGYFDYRMEGEGFESGYQSVPVDWTIGSDRKKAFFSKLKEITGL